MNGRAIGPLTEAHLRRLGELAALDREGLLTRRAHLSHLWDRILCVALCQGGALHWVDGVNVVKDLDVYKFYAAGGGPSYPPRRTENADYFDSGLTGWSERVDLLGRSVPHEDGGDGVASVLAYLRKPRTGTAWHLAQKAVVLIEPAARLGEVVWPEQTAR